VMTARCIKRSPSTRGSLTLWRQICC